MWFGLQDDINSKMRVILTDWLVEVHLKFRLRNETLFLCFQARSSHTTHRIPQSISCCANLFEFIWATDVPGKIQALCQLFWVDAIRLRISFR